VRAVQSESCCGFVLLSKCIYHVAPIHMSSRTRWVLHCTHLPTASTVNLPRHDCVVTTRGDDVVQETLHLPCVLLGVCAQVLYVRGAIKLHTTRVHALLRHPRNTTHHKGRKQHMHDTLTPMLLRIPADPHPFSPPPPHAAHERSGTASHPTLSSHLSATVVMVLGHANGSPCLEYSNSDGASTGVSWKRALAVLCFVTMESAALKKE